MKQWKNDIFLLIILFCGVILLCLLNILNGDVAIGLHDVIKLLSGGAVDNPSWSYIIENRLNRSIVAVFAGGALGVSGLILQVFFRNPLAGPGVLGITSGASLGVAIIVLGGASFGSTWGNIGIVIAGLLGALGVLFLLLIIARFIQNSVTLLVAGIMFGYFTSAFINVLILWADKTETRDYNVWSLGSFEGLSSFDVGLFTSIIGFGFILTFLLIKPLNALVAGNNAAASLGINIKQTRNLIILITGVLASIVTVYCGPVGFIGIAVPQFIRVLVKSKNHAIVLPLVFLGGGLLAILADFTVRMSSNALPLNTVTAIIGAPIIIWVIINLNRKNVSI